MTVPVLELKGVNKRFGAVQALTDVDFRVEAGEVVALVGGNRAGKSTLIKTVSGVGLADSGDSRFLGEPASISGPQDAAALGIATVYQDLALADNLDVAGTSTSAVRTTCRGRCDGSACSTTSAWSNARSS